ncbi:MAG: S8 family serine peptidase, partial [Acidimicrobiia bacterium]|nr:S8 family serine peptidase [Acidimicrobiia bacterium]
MPPDSADLERVIVEVRKGTTELGNLISQTTDAYGGRAGATFEHALHGFVAELPSSAIAALARDPNVIRITPDYAIRIADQEVSTGFDRVEADLVPRGGAPLDVDIAIIDTGVSEHPDLNVFHRVDCSSILGFCTDNAGFDGNGHGTHVAGIAAAIDNDTGVLGVAPGARIWSVKVLGADGTGFLSSLVGGIDWVTGRAAEIDVANMSLTGEFTNATFDTAISNSIAAGITYAVAAGNDGVDAAGFSPASHPEVITVSAVADGDGAGGGLGVLLNRPDEADDVFASFSNFGPAVDIAAPGVNLLSTWLDDGYAIKSGTSVASPLVAGAAALYIAQHGRDVNQDTLIDSADVAKIKVDLLGDAIAQTDLCGFSGDPDASTHAEPLLLINGSSLGGDGICTVATPDATPPTAPSFTAVANGFTVEVDWSASTDPESGILTYELWRDTVPPSGEVMVAEVDHTVLSLVDWPEPGSQFSYEMAAVNRQGIGSARSGPIAVTISDANRSDAGWWGLDDGSGVVAVDGSPWHRDGTLGGNPVWEPAGKIAGALSFDGTDDRVDLDAAILDGADDVTIALWVRTSKPGIQAMVSGANTGNDAELELVPISDTAIRFYTGETTSSFVLWDVSSFADNQWHHFAVTRDSSTDQVTLFIDGISKGTKSAVLNPLTIDPGGLLLGQEQDTVGGGFDPTQAFVGSMDEVRLYTRILTNTEITDLAMQDGTPPTAPATLSAVANGPNVDLSWSAADDPESSVIAYEIRRGINPTATTRVTEVDGATLFYRDSSAVPGVTYYYEVVAMNEAELFGPPSPQATVNVDSGASGLAGWWGLDDGSGVVAVDGSPWHRDGTLGGNPVWEPA